MKVIASYVVCNEAQLIAESMRSVKAYVDGFVVVDSVYTSNPIEATHSTDDTRKIAEAVAPPLPLTYIEASEKLTLEDARNLALNLVGDDWAFIIDGDETLLGHRPELVDLFSAIRLGEITEAVGVAVYTANLLFNGHAPKVSVDDYDTLPVIYSRGVQPRLLPAKGIDWHRVPSGTTRGIYRGENLVKVPADPRLLLINHHTRQDFAGYQHDYVWEMIERQGVKPAHLEPV